MSKVMRRAVMRSKVNSEFYAMEKNKKPPSSPLPRDGSSEEPKDVPKIRAFIGESPKKRA